MTHEPDRPEPVEPGDARAAAVRRRRRAEVFGDVLPESTQDDRDQQSRGDGGSDEWFRRNVPPHHG